MIGNHLPSLKHFSLYLYLHWIRSYRPYFLGVEYHAVLLPLFSHVTVQKVLTSSMPIVCPQQQQCIVN